MPRLRSIIAIALTAVAVAVFSVAPALAGIHGGFIITATTPSGDAASYEIPAPADAVYWTWSSTERIEMISPTTGDLIAVINPDGKESTITFVDDPFIAMSFAVMSGAATTTFTISSGLLSFAAFNAEARATVGMSVSDTDGDGVTLTGGGPTGGAYLAQYNGVAPGGTTFAEVIASLSAGPFSSSTTSVDTPAVGFSPIGVVGDMSVQVKFDLSAYDQASGTSTYTIRDFPLATENVSWGKVKSLYSK
jgi:hypothetical protein